MAHGDKEKNKPEVKQDKDLYRVTYTQEILPIGGAVSVPAPTDSNKHLGETANPFPKNTKFALADAGFSSGLKIESTGAITGILGPSYSEGRKALYVDVTFPDGSMQKASAEYVATKPLTVELDTASFKDVQGPFHVWQLNTSATGTPKNVPVVEGENGIWRATLVPLADEAGLSFFVYKGTPKVSYPEFATNGAGKEIRTGNYKGKPGDKVSVTLDKLDSSAPRVGDSRRFKAELELPEALNNPTFIYFKGSVESDKRLVPAKSLVNGTHEMKYTKLPARIGYKLAKPTRWLRRG